MITHQIDHLTEDERRLLELRQRSGRRILGGAGRRRPVAGTRRRRTRAGSIGPQGSYRSSPPGVSEWPDGTYSGCYAFRHILYQNVIYQQLAPGTARANAPAAWASGWRKPIAGRTPEIAPLLALHFEQGRDFPNALRYLGQAAESSAKRLGHAEAASYLTRALGILDRFDARRMHSGRASRCCGSAAGRCVHAAISPAPFAISTR